VTPDERDDEVRFRALRLALARLSERWWAVLVAAFAAGCIVAVVFRLVASGRSWESTAQGAGFFLGLLGIVLGIMLAYGGRGSMGATRRDPHGERLRGATYQAKPLTGLAEVLFCLPTVVVALTM
jgi:hypothetical protein